MDVMEGFVVPMCSFPPSLHVAPLSPMGPVVIHSLTSVVSPVGPVVGHSVISGILISMVVPMVFPCERVREVNVQETKRRCWGMAFKFIKLKPEVIF